MRDQKQKTRKLKLEHYAILAVLIIIVSALSVPFLIRQSGLDDIGTGDQSGVTIAGLSHSPTSPTPSDSVTVTCSATDAEGSLSSVTLFYELNGIKIEYDVTMTGVGTTYTGTIPAQGDGTTVKYWVAASGTMGGETSAFKFYTSNTPPPPPPPPEENETVDDVIWQLTVFDNTGVDISDTIRSATIRGTISFEVAILSGASRVYTINLEVTGISTEASPYGLWKFTKGTEDVWTLQFDTTVINNGEYAFVFQLVLYPIDYVEGGHDPDWNIMPFSSFTFEQDEGDGTLTIAGIPLTTIILVIIIVGVFITVFVITLKTVKKKSKIGRGRGSY